MRKAMSERRSVKFDWVCTPSPPFQCAISIDLISVCSSQQVFIDAKINSTKCEGGHLCNNVTQSFGRVFKMKVGLALHKERMVTQSPIDSYDPIVLLAQSDDCMRL